VLVAPIRLPDNLIVVKTGAVATIVLSAATAASERYRNRWRPRIFYTPWFKTPNGQVLITYTAEQMIWAATPASIRSNIDPGGQRSKPIARILDFNRQERPRERSMSCKPRCAVKPPPWMSRPTQISIVNPLLTRFFNRISDGCLVLTEPILWSISTGTAAQGGSVSSTASPTLMVQSRITVSIKPSTCFEPFRTRPRLPKTPFDSASRGRGLQPSQVDFGPH